MINELKALAESHGDRIAIISIKQAKDILNDLAKYRNENDTQLSEYQKRILDMPNRFDAPAHMKSIIIAAVPRPAYAKVTWNLDRKQYNAFSGVAAASDRAAEYIAAAVRAAGFDINRETSLPLKRIAAHSGLGYYGRNNILYADGLGSAMALLAFTTDIPPQDSIWQEPSISLVCDGCKICETLCPTSAIVPGKFQIDSDRCLTKLNQGTEDFPDWVPRTAHHSTYYCLMCQARCPMNKGLEVIELTFNETETAYIMNSASYDDATDELKSKIALMTGFGKPEWVQRNLRVLFDAMDEGHVPKL